MTEGDDGTNYLQMAAIKTTAQGTIASTRVPTQMEFQTATDATPSVLTTALTLDKSQNAQFAGKITSYGGSAPTNGQLLIGDTTNGDLELATLTAGSNVTITNAGHSIMIAASGGGGTPGGSNTQVQYNNSSAFGGISGQTTDGTITTFAASDLNLTDALASNEAAPSTPASGKTKIYVDSTSKNLAAKNDAGTVNHGVQTQSASTGTFIEGISDAGAVTTGTAVTSIATTSPISGGTITGTGTLSLLTNVDFSFTNMQTITLAPAANTVVNGFRLLDTTAATAGGNQRYSPAIQFSGQGWKTNSTAASQEVDAQLVLEPIEGTANPTGRLSIRTQVNGGGFSERWGFFTSGGLSYDSFDPGALALNTRYIWIADSAGTAGHVLRSDGSTGFQDAALAAADLSNGTTGTSSVVLALNPTISSPTILTGLYDTNGNAELLFTATASAVNSWTMTNGAAGIGVVLSATKPPSGTSAAAGIGAYLTGSDATAGSSTGAADGGILSLASGSAARNSSGNANGGNVNLNTGTGIGTGTSGYINFQIGGADKMRLFATGGLSLGTTTDPGAGVINANTGFKIGGAAASGNIPMGNGTNFVAGANIHTIQWEVDNGSTALNTGTLHRVYNAKGSGTIVGWSVTAYPSGSVTWDVYKAASGTTPTVSIVGAGTAPGVSSGTQSGITAPSSWTTTTFSDGDAFDANIATATTSTHALVVLYYTPTP
jgi:hypothetical protein